jgi:hypothetical protein
MQTLRGMGMKNQYFGDVNDYQKYSLLRRLGGNGKLRVTVCWMLTPDDTRSDGSRVGYLREPEIWREHDPVVFEHLREHVIRRGIRSVNVIEDVTVLPNCQFFGEAVEDDAEQRGAYFRRFLKFASGTDLVFFDPDNGLGVKSVPPGSRKSSKYVYWDEIARTYSAGHSILIYQHFPRKPRQPFLASLAKRFGALSGPRHMLSFTTSHVAFLLVPQENHQETLVQTAIQIERSFPGLISVQAFCIPGTTHKSGRGIRICPQGLAN